LQKFGEGRNDVDLGFTRILAKRLADSGNEIIGFKSVIAYMATNRIRSVGHLETYNISRLRTDLGVSFVLLGTITERKERPEPSLGLTLELVRTSDARTVWNYIGSLSTGEERRILGIGEPKSTDDLQPLLLDEIIAQWPWQMIKEEQPSSTINIETAVLEPKYVKPGEEVRSTVRLRNSFRADQAPRVFFKVGQQLYPATVSSDGRTYTASWVVGEKDGSFPVILLFSWPLYGRTETALLGRYIIDGSSPLFELQLSGAKIVNGIPVFNDKLVIKPRMLVRKTMSRWRLAFYHGNGDLYGDMTGDGNLPESFVWGAKDKYGNIENGAYDVVVEAWDQAGNMGKATRRVELNRSSANVEVSSAVKGNELVVNLKHQGRVPLAFWRLQMWSEEGDLLSQTEGKELPIRIGVKLPGSGQDRKIEGTLFAQDIFGNQIRQKVSNLLPHIEDKAKPKVKEEDKTVSESWVDEF
jgi:hypothetical protein